jgi:NADPH2:quinone reductase
MKALILKEFNTPFQLQEVQKPTPGAGEVLVKIAASAINPLDLKIVAGQAAHAKTTLPAILGIDMAGTVEAVGEGVSGFAIGDEVYGMAGGIGGVPGSLAAYGAFDADLLALKPKNLSMQEAAALPLIFITAWEGLVDRAGVGAGKTVLIHGGAGGVGHVAIQIARAAGAEVYATVSAQDFDLIKSYGAVPIDYKHSSVEAYMQKFSQGEGFDIVMDNVGGSVLDDSFKAVKRYTGHVVSILGWGTHSLAPLSFRGATYSGVFTLYPLISGVGRKHHGDILREATKLAEAGKLKPVLDSEVYRPDTIGVAYAAIAGGKAKGKVVINLY